MGSVAAGDGSTCATKSGTNALWCWGNNSFGQLGIGTSAPLSTRPVAVVGLPNGAIDVDISWGHACAVTPAAGGSGALMCWGRNGSGELGTGTFGGEYRTPTQVVSGSLGSARTVATGFNLHVCNIWCNRYILLGPRRRESWDRKRSWFAGVARQGGDSECLGRRWDRWGVHSRSRAGRAAVQRSLLGPDCHSVGCRWSRV